MKKHNLILKALVIISLSMGGALANGRKSSQADYYNPYYAENGSTRGEISKKTNRPKNEYVRPYNRKDYTRVRSHYKSSRRK